MKRAFADLMPVIMVVCSCFCIAQAKVSNDKSIVFSQQWRPPGAPWSPASSNAPDQPVFDVRIVEANPESRIGGIVKIFSSEKLVSSYGFPALIPTSMFQLNDGNLATNWVTACGGDGDHQLYVFTYSKGRIHQVLATESGMLPEFVYQSKAHIMGQAGYDKNGIWQERGGPYYQQRIIIANTDWVQLKEPYLGKKSDRQPVTADIYTWDIITGKYKARRKVPWSKRLQML